MDERLHELGIQAPDLIPAGRIGLRLVVAAILGGVIGWERERRGRDAGFRTHMLIALGAALFTALPLEVGSDDPGLALSELVRGIASGIGFLGAGAILKMSQRGEIKGLTTAAGIWATASIGLTVVAGWFSVAIFAAGLTWFILKVVSRLDPSPDQNKVSDA